MSRFASVKKKEWGGGVRWGERIDVRMGSQIKKNHILPRKFPNEDDLVIQYDTSCYKGNWKMYLCRMIQENHPKV